MSAIPSPRTRGADPEKIGGKRVITEETKEEATPSNSDEESGRWNRKASILIQERKMSQRRMRLGRRSKSQKAAALELDKTRAEAELLERHRAKQLLMRKMESNDADGSEEILHKDSVSDHVR